MANEKKISMALTSHEIRLLAESLEVFMVSLDQQRAAPHIKVDQSRQLALLHNQLIQAMKNPQLAPKEQAQPQQQPAPPQQQPQPQGEPNFNEGFEEQS